MSYLTRTGASVLFVTLASCSTDDRTREPVVSTASGKSSVSDAGTAVARRGKSLIRFVNAIPGDSRLDLSGDDRTVFYDVAYKDVTPYTEIGDNVVQFRLRRAGRDSAWADNTETLVNGSRYTVLALPDRNDGARLVVLTDELVPDSGKSRLRVVHAAPYLEDVDVRLEGRQDPVFDDVPFGTGVGFRDLAPQEGAILIVRDDAPGTVLRERLRMDPGHSYTVVIAGERAGNVEAILVTDAIRTYATR